MTSSIYASFSFIVEREREREREREKVIIISMDCRLKCNYSMIVGGPSSSGKTTFVSRLLDNASTIYNKAPGRFFYFYKEWQPLFEKLTAQLGRDKISFIEDRPTYDFFEEIANRNENPTFIIDDSAFDANQDIVKVFTVATHHLKVNVIFLVQNIFWKNKFARDIKLSATYIVCTKNPQDNLQISNFSKQFSPGNSACIRDIFKSATAAPYSYCLFDMHQETEERNRIMANIFQEDGTPMKLYRMKQ